MTKVILTQPNLPWVNHFYYLAFPGLRQVYSESRKAIQTIGVDKILRFRSQPSITVDEKLRYQSYPDILLEEYSNWELKKAGWLIGGSAANYIAYVVRPTKKIYLMSYHKLKASWDRNYEFWLNKYGRKFGTTEGADGRVMYHTSNIPVPKSELEIEFSNDPALNCYVPER